MFENAISVKTKKLFKTIAKQDFINAFYLAGGTALALRLGHLISIDLDFFSKYNFHEKTIQNKLKNLGNLTINQIETQTINAILNDVKLSLIHYPYNLIAKSDDYFGIKIASIEDIACMKIDAVSSRGTKRDFVDIYYICEHGFDLKNILNLFDEKYKGIKFNRLYQLKSLVYFEDADAQPMPKMLVKTDWEKVKMFFRTTVPKLV